MARIDIKSTAGGAGSGTVTSVSVSSTTLTVTGSPITSSGTITANIPDGYLKVGTGVTGSLQNVVDTNGTATQLFLSTTGIQATSKIQITTAETSYIDAEDNSGNNRFTVGRDPSSQLVTVDFASVPTVLTTPVGAIRTATDGVTLANVMTFLENGKIGLGTDTPAVKLDVHSADAIVSQFNKTVSGNSYIQQLVANSAKWKHGFTTATGAFDIIDDVNALTRLSVLNTGQLKLNAYTSTSAFTGTTAGFLAFDASGNILSVTSPATSPAGSTGAVQFNNAGAFGADSTNFFWDDTNNRLGVGTNAPTRQVEFVGSAATPSALALRYGTATGGGPLIELDAGAAGLNYLIVSTTSSNGSVGANALGIFDGTDYRFVIKSGNVGIGQITPTARLQVKGSGATSATTSLLVQNSGGTQTMKLDDSGRLFMDANNYIGQSGEWVCSLNFIINGNITNSNSGYVQLQKAYATSGLVAGTTTLNASAILEANSTTQGFLPPRMTTAQKNAIGTPAAGLMVYDTTLNKLCVYTTAWETITSV